MRLHIEDVSWSVDEHKIVSQMNLDASSGEFVGIVGPNGSGKSTLLRCIYRVLRPDAGFIALNDENVWQVSAKEAARRTAVVIQEMPTEFDFTVHDIVTMGRTPHKGMFDTDSEEDLQIIDEALARVEMSDFAERNFNTLSGGEKQRVLIARALAQQTQFMVLDEPTNHLDVRFQLEILELVKGLKVTTIAAIHDLNLAATYCDRIYIVKDGKIFASGLPTEVLQPEVIRSAFGVGSMIDKHPLTGKPRITFYPESALNVSSVLQEVAE